MRGSLRVLSIIMTTNTIDMKKLKCNSFTCTGVGGRSQMTSSKLGHQIYMFVSVPNRKRPKFRFGVRLVLAGSVRQKFCRAFAEFFNIQFHVRLHLQYTGIKRTDYAILCNK